MLKTLKSLVQGEGAVIVILTGIEDALAERLLRRLGQAALCEDRAAGQGHPTADGKTFWKLRRRFCADAGFAVPEQEEIVARLIHASRARFGRR